MDRMNDSQDEEPISSFFLRQKKFAEPEPLRSAPQSAPKPGAHKKNSHDPYGRLQRAAPHVPPMVNPMHPDLQAASSVMVGEPLSLSFT